MINMTSGIPKRKCLPVLTIDLESRPGGYSTKTLSKSVMILDCTALGKIQFYVQHNIIRRKNERLRLIGPFYQTVQVNAIFRAISSESFRI